MKRFVCFKTLVLFVQFNFLFYIVVLQCLFIDVLKSYDLLFVFVVVEAQLSPPQTSSSATISSQQPLSSADAAILEKSNITAWVYTRQVYHESRIDIPIHNSLVQPIYIHCIHDWSMRRVFESFCYEFFILSEPVWITSHRSFWG